MENLSQNEKMIWSGWKEKSPREVAREAAAKGTHIALAIKFLMSKNNWAEETAKDWFFAEVKAWTVQLLINKQIFKVLHILNKVQINPEEHLLTLAKESIEIEYRDFIVDHLKKLEDKIKPENLEKWQEFERHWNLLRYLEKSFEVDGTFKQNKVFGSIKDRVIVTESEIKAMTVEKILKYPQEWKSKISITLFFNSFEFSLLDFPTPIQVWNYLLEQNKAMVLVRWINLQMSELVRDMNARYNFFNNEGFINKLLNVDTNIIDKKKIEKLDNIFRNWPITQEMIDNVSKIDCFKYTKMCVYDTLCSYGIIVESERKDLCGIISRLARTQNLRQIDNIFSETCATITKRDFYIELAKYGVKHQLYKMLTICVEGEVLGNEFTDVDEDVKDCLELWLSFKSIEHISDRQSHVVPVYKTCEQISKDNIDSYIASNPYLVLGMLLLEEKAKLFDLFSKEEFLRFTDFSLPNKGYHERFPHLYNVYQKYLGKDQSSALNDVNVYQLLSGYRGLDVSKILEFQLSNQNTSSFNNEKPDRRSLGSLLPNDMDINAAEVKILSQRLSEMPHFANEKLMKRYGHIAKLNHVYYLKQCRPCNASQAFVAQQYYMYNRLQDKSIKSACCEAHAIALENWNDPAMSACAISFIAMIGCNPTRCRVHMSVARMLHKYITSVKAESDEIANKTVNDYMFRLSQSNETVAKEILQYLEEITYNNIHKKKDSDGRFDMSFVLYESQVMVKFAILHNLPLPEMLLRDFVTNNSWFDFLLYADVFRYPVSQMLLLAQEFEKKSYSEHMKNIILHRNVEDLTEKEMRSSTGTLQRRLSRLNSVETSPTHSSTFEFPEMSTLTKELWEVVALCHGPEDPPGALVRAAPVYQEPLLALLATCYEPNAAGVVWAYWVLATLGEAVPQTLRDSLQWDISQQHPSDEEFQKIAELCLETGYVRTLHESMLIFFPDSPLSMLTAFLCRSLWQRTFDAETNRLIFNFTQHCQRKYSVDSTLPWMLSKQSLQRVAVSLVTIGLRQGFDSAFHQKQFLSCLVDARFTNEFSELRESDYGLRMGGFIIKCLLYTDDQVLLASSTEELQEMMNIALPSPDYKMIYEVLKISMETSSVIEISKLLNDDVQQYLTEWIEMYTETKNFDTALKIAKLVSLPVNEIMIADWSHKHNALLEKEDIQDKDITLFIAECSESFKINLVTFNAAVNFLLHHVKQVSKCEQKFYCYRVILSWFETHREYGTSREELEHAMWNAYFECESQDDIFLNDHLSTTHYILNNQKDAALSKRIAQFNSDKPFSMLLSELEIESDIVNIENVVILEEPEAIDAWRKTLHKLLGLKLMVDAFRLSTLFQVTTEFRYQQPACPVQIIKTCLKLAEGSCSPYELPQELRLVISSPYMQNKFTNSETSDASFEELVLIQEKQENLPENAVHLARREDADKLSALEALAARSGLLVAKQVANYFRISLQIGWNYGTVLKYQNNPVDFISYVSGRSRMSLANLIFRTFNISSKQVSEFLCQEMVSAIISPHLVKTSSFRQKEHFQYTLWGYTLNSDMEMFLNMRPDACSQIGRLILDHLMAFRKIYRSSCHSAGTALSDRNLDVETLIDEEYQTVDEAEVESLTNKSATTDGGTITSAESESTFSMSTVYSFGTKLTRESRRNLFDVITRSKVHIPYEVKSNIRRITKGSKLSSKQVNIISIELLVLAHECFSCACDTEGVAVVLRSAQALISQLLAARSWRLMVRLLTGLARYTEMAYVFQMLRDNHQFEYLLGQFDYMLGQQQDKISEFKQGLLDFLKNHCPGDTEAYIMVALHFNMYSEAANVKKKQALDLINDLEKIAMDAARASSRASKKPFQPPEWLMIHDNMTTRSLLDTALEHCSDSSELFLQGGCMGLAGDMADLAQQIALQISLLNASPTRLILNRSSEQVYKLVSEYLSFMEGLVLMVGRGSVQWRELAYRRTLANDQAYLRDMAAYRPDVAADFLNRYKTEKKTTTASRSAMTELQNLCR